MKRLVLIPLLAFLGHQGIAAAQPGQSPRQITVHGEAKILLTPDKAIIELGVETIDPDVETSKSKNSEAARRVIQSITDLGVDLANVQTGYLRIEPVHQSQQKHEEPLGYECHSRIVVTLTDLSIFETAVAAALKNGANYLHGTHLTTSEPDKHREEAMIMALRNARAKAAKMAAVLGQSIGRPLSVGAGYSGLRSSFHGQGQSVFSGTGRSETDSFAPGQIIINASIAVSFELQDADD